MPTRRLVLLYFALSVSESTWLYVVSGLLGLLVGMPGPVLAWPWVLITIAGAMLTSNVVSAIRLRSVGAPIVTGLIALSSVYLIVALRPFDGHSGFDLVWLIKLVEGNLSGDALLGAFASAALTIFCWRRAIGITASEMPELSLHRTFRIGTIIIAITLLLEIGVDNTLGARTMLVPFFASTLTGMAIARFVGSQRKNSTNTWGTVIGASVVSVVCFGVLLGVVAGGYVSRALGILWHVWEVVVDGILWIVQWPLKYLFKLIEWIIDWIRNRGSPEPDQPELIAPGIARAIEATQHVSESSSGILDQIMQLMKWPISLAILFAIFVLVTLVLKRSKLRSSTDPEFQREKIDGEHQVGKDLADLMLRLIPKFKSKQVHGQSWHYPQNEPGISDVFRIYFDYLQEAINRGMVLNPHQTPNERAPDIEAALPGAPVTNLTACFNDACYGHQPSHQAVISKLQAGLEQVRAQPVRGSDDIQ